MSPTGEHYTRNVEWVMAECRKCGKQTPHRVDDRRKGPCLTCLEKLNAAHDAKPEPTAKQEGFKF